MFFGNMGNEYKDELRKARQDTKGLVYVELTCMNKELLKELNEVFPLFISQTNVGTRQNKGYGSFSLWNKSRDIQGIFGKEKQLHYLDIDSSDEKDIFLAINYYYQRLKSGINFRNSYHHSFFKTYLKSMTWEKPWMKALFIAEDKPKEKDHRFARALMGMPGSFVYKPAEGKHPPYPRREVEISVKDAREDDNNDKKPAPISRIKSPITFKPICNRDKTRIYIFTRAYTQEEIKLLAGQEFIFEGGGKKERLTLPDAYQIEDLNFEKMITAYHKHLGASFTARDYARRQEIEVSVFPKPAKKEERRDDDDDGYNYIPGLSDRFNISLPYTFIKVSKPNIIGYLRLILLFLTHRL